MFVPLIEPFARVQDVVVFKQFKKILKLTYASVDINTLTFPYIVVEFT